MKQHDSDIFVCYFKEWRQSVFDLLDASEVISSIKEYKRVIIKPNLVESQPPPVTTPVELVRAITEFIHARLPETEIIIAEGSGSVTETTMSIFKSLGYYALLKGEHIGLIDLNEEKSVRLVNDKCSKWPEMFLPEIIMDSFLISVPVLKAHTLAGITLSMKNMMGVLPPNHYQQDRSWKKSSFHRYVHDSLFDLNTYRRPDFTIIDATVGMKDAHLWGPVCNPKPNMLIAGFDPVATDAYGTDILNRDWRRIGHISMSNGLLGSAEHGGVLTV